MGNTFFDLAKGLTFFEFLVILALKKNQGRQYPSPPPWRSLQKHWTHFFREKKNFFWRSPLSRGRQSHIRIKCISKAQIFDLLNRETGSKMDHPWPLFYLFSSFQTNVTIFTANICEKCPSSIWCCDSNPQSSENESPPITTRPGLL